MKKLKHDKNSARLHERIGLLIYRGQYGRALEMLDLVIEDPMPLECEANNK